MELRQLRYFVHVVEHGSMARAATELDLVPSALSQQISRLEGELATRLLRRTPTGVIPTDAGVAFLRQARLALRHADDAAHAARHARLSGHVSVGLAPTTAAILGLPLMQAMRERYPEVRLQLVESLSGHLTAMLNSRQLDLAVLFHTGQARRWSLTPLLDERLFLIAIPGLRDAPRPRGSPPRARVRLASLASTPLILPSGPHGLRETLDAAFQRAKLRPNVVAEVDSLSLLMDAVSAGFGATIQPWAATARLRDAVRRLELAEIADAGVLRHNVLCTLSDDELSPAALAVRVVLADVARSLVSEGRWAGAQLAAPPGRRPLAARSTPAARSIHTDTSNEGDR